VARQATLAEDRAATQEPTAHPASVQADSVACSDMIV